MTRILNADTLASHGNIAGRKTVLEILEAGLRGANPYHNVRKLIRLVGDDTLVIGGDDFEPLGDPRAGEEIIDLKDVDRIFVVGAGKGIQYTAKGIEDALGDRLTGGHVIDKHGSDLILQKINVTFGAHPIPDEGCVLGCEKIVALLQDLRPDDLVFTVMGNGVSSLLTLPVPGISLEDVRRTTHLFQIERGGCTIDLTPVRNHIDQLKGGKLSRLIPPAKAIHILAFLRPSYHELMVGKIYQWLHSIPSIHTYADAINSLKRWDCWDEVPASVRDHLLKADPAFNCLFVEEFEEMDNRVFCVLPDHLGMVEMARQKAIELGYKPHVLFHNFDLLAEAREMGKLVANFARHSEQDNQPFEPPCALISTGELLVTVGKETGMGGRNQEYALAAALELATTHHVVIGSIDSDGTDGPGRQFVSGYDEVPVLTGGIVDNSTPCRAKEMGVDLFEALKRHNTSPTLYQLGDGVIASPAMSMGDLSVTLISKEERKL